MPPEIKSAKNVRHSNSVAKDTKGIFCKYNGNITSNYPAIKDEAMVNIKCSRSILGSIGNSALGVVYNIWQKC